VKGTTKLRRDDESVLFVVDTAHLRDWSESRLPVLLAVCDVTNAAGYWLLVNDVLEAGEIDPDECLKRLWTPGYPVTSKRVSRNPQLFRKLLKQWSGRWDSNPRRPAWEDDYKLETKNIAFLHLVLAIENSPVYALCSVQLANRAQTEHAL